MRFSIFFIFAFLLNLDAFAIKLSAYSPYEYDVRFTNPECKEYSYPDSVVSNSGERLRVKPKNAFCTSSDARESAAREESPEYKLKQWINDPKTTEIFMTFLSFSSGSITKELCGAADRGVKITFILDKGAMKVDEEGQEPRGMRRANELQACGQEGNKPKLHIRGQVKNEFGYAHNKLLIFNPQSNSEIRFVYGSGNMSSGIVIHHENWHFVRTNVKSYFAQRHLCLMDGMIDHSKNKNQFVSYIRNCSGKIRAKEESDIKTFFVPGEGERAVRYIKNNIKYAKKSIWLLIGLLSVN